MRAAISGVSKGEELVVVANEELVVEVFSFLRNHPSTPHSGSSLGAFFLGAICGILFNILAGYFMCVLHV